MLAVHNTAKFSPALFQPDGETRHDWEIFVELQTRMEREGLFGSLLGNLFSRVKRNVIKQFLGPEKILDLSLRFGPYGAGVNPFSKGLTLRKVQKAVHGIDLGPLTPCLPGRLRTSDKRIELAPEVLVKDVERVKTKFVNSLECGGKRSATPLWIDAAAMQPGSITSSPASPSPSLSASHDSSNDFSGDLILIGRRQLRSNNSWMHNSQRLVKGKPGKSRCTILMHPTDAAERQLRPGQEVLVRSRVGSLVVPIEISEEIMPGVVSIPHGWGHGRVGIHLEVAQQHAGESINDITDNLTIDALCGTAAFNGTWVSVVNALECGGKRSATPLWIVS